MTKLKLLVIALISILIISCSSADSNVKVNVFHGFKPVYLAKNKTIFLPFILESKEYSNTYKLAFNKTYKNYLSNFNAILPHQAEALIDTNQLNTAFDKLKAVDIKIAIAKWVAIGKKLKYRYIVLVILKKPNHVKIKKSFREIHYSRHGAIEGGVPNSTTVYINANVWYQKGALYIIDTKIGKLVYSLSKETKSGFRHRSTHGHTSNKFLHSRNLREGLSTLGDDQIPTLQNAVTLFFKGIFESWK